MWKKKRGRGGGGWGRKRVERGKDAVIDTNISSLNKLFLSKLKRTYQSRRIETFTSQLLMMLRKSVALVVWMI